MHTLRQDGWDKEEQPSGQNRIWSDQRIDQIRLQGIVPDNADGIPPGHADEEVLGEAIEGVVLV